MARGVEPKAARGEPPRGNGSADRRSSARFRSSPPLASVFQSPSHGLPVALLRRAPSSMASAI